VSAACFVLWPSNSSPQPMRCKCSRGLFAAGGLPPFRPDFPCYRNPLPDLNGPAGGVSPPDLKVVP